MELAVFFVIGGVINVVVLVLFGVWVRREWRRTGKKTESHEGGHA